MNDILFSWAWVWRSSREHPQSEIDGLGMTVIINGKEKTVKADASKCELKDLLRDNTEYNQKRLI